MAHADSRLTILPPAVAANPVSANPSSAPFVPLAQLRKLRECEQVAAVCYRRRGDGIEFLLVRTRSGGRWTFPKGSAEPGLTHAQAAALEAFEEAGVHGRIEEESFTRYVRGQRRDPEHRSSRSRKHRGAVSAYLCEVLRLGPPQESKRHRTWFCVDDAKRHLREGRKSEDGAAFARVVLRAVERIQQSRGGIGFAEDHGQAYREQVHQARGHAGQKDALQKVKFDYAEASPLPDVRRRLAETRQPVVLVASGPQREVLPCEVLEFSPPRVKKVRALGAGSSLRG
jgi:8-oxo-dGTP pyrophosphatase MutT (NUDIX family)